MTDKLTFWLGADAEDIWAWHLSKLQETHDAAMIAAANCPVVEVDDE